MKIFVTGGAGYIGSHMCAELLRTGYEVVALDNFSNSEQRSIDAVKKISGKSFSFYNEDMRDENALEKIFAANGLRFFSRKKYDFETRVRARRRRNKYSRNGFRRRKRRDYSRRKRKSVAMGRAGNVRKPRVRRTAFEFRRVCHRRKIRGALRAHKQIAAHRLRSERSSRSHFGIIFFYFF